MSANSGIGVLKRFRSSELEISLLGVDSSEKIGFLTGDGPKTLGVDDEGVKATQYYFGLKGYVTFAGADVMTGAEVVVGYGALFKVEATFRMANSDLVARSIFYYTRESIEAHLSVVFCALAISRHIQARAHMSIKKVLNTVFSLALTW